MLSVRLGYVVVYVDDVAQTLEFYERAFGMARGHVDESGTYAELDTGATKLAFVSNEQASGLIPGGYRPNDISEIPPGVEVALVTDELDAAYARAVAAGAFPVAAPADQPWGQRIAYVRDTNGILVELVTPLEP